MPSSCRHHASSQASNAAPVSHHDTSSTSFLTPKKKTKAVNYSPGKKPSRGDQQTVDQ